jgi:DNA-3-methyladenine glycosylase
MRRLRPNVPDLALTSGPGKLTKALGIDKSLNEVDMTNLGALFVKDPKNVQIEIVRSTRVGISVGKERLWRFYVSGNQYVSKVRRQQSLQALVTTQGT